MFDFARTLSLIRGAIFEPDVTWVSYLPESGSWQKTAAILTGPLVVGTAILSWLLSIVFPSPLPVDTGPSLFGVIRGIVGAGAAAFAVAFIVSFLAGQFNGKHDFAKGLAATSLAFVPGYAGQVFSRIPWIGWLLGLGLFVYALVLLWRIIPVYLGVPEASRTGHYILSLVASIIIMAMLGFVLGFGMTGGPAPGGVGGAGGNGAPAGMFGGMERQATIMEAAGEDRYDPPRDGKLTDRQVRRYIGVMEKTRSLRAAQTEDLKQLSEKAEDEELQNLGEMFSGVTRMMEMQTAEMEVVKTSGGNWAEHVWIRDQLRLARVQKDLNDAVSHNYRLYQQYESQLQDFD